MAISNTFSTSNSNLKYNIEVIQNSQNVVNNTSNVTIKVKYWKTYDANTWGTGTVYCKINGTEYSASISNSQVITINGIVLFTKTLDIGHNSDGSKSLSVSARTSHDRFSSSEQGFDVTLTKIPRASSISINSNNVNAGSNISVTINSANSSFKHDYHLVFGSSPGNVFGFGKEVAGGTYSVTIPNTTINKIPSATSGYGTIYCDTYSGSTHLGTTSVGITINVPSSVIPTISSVSATRIDNGVPTDWGVYVKGKSKARIIINEPSGAYGSTINSSSISGFGATWNGSDVTTGEIWTTGNQTITARVYDSRGRTTSKTTSVVVYDYWNPVINSCSVTRCTSNGTPSEDGTYAKVTVEYAFASVNSKNSCAGKVWFRKKGDTAWSAEISLSNNTPKVIGGSMSTDYGYEIFFRAQDAFTYTDKVIEMPSARVTMDFRAGGNGIAIGKVAERDGLEIDWTTYFNQQAQFFNQIIANRQGDGVTLLKFNTDRQWEFQQGGSGSTSTLDLVSLVDSKAFRVTSPNKSKEIRMHVSDAASILSVDNNTVWHNGNCTTGTGVNQQWWRFENGLQIIRQWKILGSIALTYQWGSLYTQGGAQTNLDNYAVAFVTAPQVTIQAEGGGSSLFTLRSQSATSTWAGSYELARGASGNCPAVVIHVMSIGQWK